MTINFGNWIYVLIFLGETIYLLTDSVYIICLWKKKPVSSAVAGFIRTVIWVVVTSSVIVDIQSDPLKILFYCLGYVVGVWLGVSLEKKLSIGYFSVRIVTTTTEAEKILIALKQLGVSCHFLGASTERSNQVIGTVTVQQDLLPETITVVRQTAPGTYTYARKLNCVFGMNASRLLPFGRRRAYRNFGT